MNDLVLPLSRHPQGPPRVRAGFTLLEVLVGLAIGLALMSTTLAFATWAMQRAALSQARAALARDAARISQTLSWDLRQAGLGVPRSTNIDDGSRFSGALLVASPTEVGLVADLPRPDAQYNAFGYLHRRPGGNKHHTAWHTENNGSCMPPGCDTAVTSLFFPGETGCNTTGSYADRTCPWGMRRVVHEEYIQVVAGSGEWTTQAIELDADMHDHNYTDATGTNVDGPFSPKLSGDWDGVWPNDDDDAAPVSIPGTGFVATVDRVFYWYADQKLYRLQCGGKPLPGDATWIVRPTTPGADCVGPEVMARDLASFDFEFLNKAGTALGLPLATANDRAKVATVRFRMRFRKRVRDDVVYHEVIASAALPNLF